MHLFLQLFLIVVLGPFTANQLVRTSIADEYEDKIDVGPALWTSSGGSS